jgi:hypothetical protein
MSDFFAITGILMILVALVGVTILLVNVHRKDWP